MRTVAVILAAGASTRMQRPKQLLKHTEHHLLNHVIFEVKKTDVQQVIVVLGANADSIRPTLPLSEIVVLENKNWQAGMSASLKTALSFLEKDPPDALLTLVCDQPFVTSDLIDQLISKGKTTDFPIVASAYDGTVGVPALFKSSIFPKLKALNNQEGAKKVILKNRALVGEVSFPKGGFDLDTPEAYQDFLKRLK